MHLTPLQYARGSEVRMILERAASEPDDRRDNNENAPKTKGTVLFGDDMTVDDLFSLEISKDRSKSHLSADSVVEKRDILLSDELFSNDLTEALHDSHESDFENDPSGIENDNCSCFDRELEYSNIEFSSNNLFENEIENKLSGIIDSCEGNFDACFPCKETQNLHIEENKRNKFDIESYNSFIERRSTVAEIFSAMETDAIDRLRMIADGINKFDRRSTLRSVSTIDKSSAFLHRQFSQQLNDDVFKEQDVISTPYLDEEPFDISLQSHSLDKNIVRDKNKYFCSIDPDKKLTDTNFNTTYDKDTSISVTELKDKRNETESKSNETSSSSIVCGQSLSPFISVAGESQILTKLEENHSLRDVEGSHTPQVTCSITSRKDDDGAISIKSDDLISSRITQLITEAIDDTDSDIICTSPS